MIIVPGMATDAIRISEAEAVSNFADVLHGCVPGRESIGTGAVNNESQQIARFLVHLDEARRKANMLRMRDTPNGV